MGILWDGRNIWCHWITHTAELMLCIVGRLQKDIWIDFGCLESRWNDSILRRMERRMDGLEHEPIVAGGCV